jgi:cyclohexadieny/prephenate dehydrogenase
MVVIGLGLIGASLCRVARQQKIARVIVGADANPTVRQRASEIDLADQIAPTVEEAVTGADLIFLCTPVGAMGAVAKAIGPCLSPGAIVTDVGGSKVSVIEAVGPHLPDSVHFIPGHPVAGTEYSGPDAGFATLFVNRWAILTPPEGVDPQALDRLIAFWSAAGANSEVMSAAHHDIVLAITSHVPHLIAYTIVRTASDLEKVTQAEVMKFSAGGFRDFTRIASSDPTMWRDIFLSNRDAVLEMLGRFNEDLSALQRMVRDGDGQGLFDLFTRTRAIRRGIIAQGQETAEADFGRRKSQERA